MPIFLPINEWALPVIFGLQAGSPLLADDATRGAFSRARVSPRPSSSTSTSSRRASRRRSATTRSPTSTRSSRAATSPCSSPGPWNLGEFRRRLPAELQDAWATAPLARARRRGQRRVARRRLEPRVFRESRAQGRGVAAHRVSLAAGASGALLPAHRRSARRGARRGTTRRSRATPTTRAFREQLARVRADAARCRSGSRSRSRLQDAAELAVRGAAPPDSALAALDRDVDRILEKRRWILERGSCASRRRALRASVERQRARAGWLFLAPALALIAIFFVLPVLAGLAPQPHRLRHLRDRRARAPRASSACATTRSCSTSPLFWKALAQHALLRARRRAALGRGVAGRGAASSTRKLARFRDASSARSSSRPW